MVLILAGGMFALGLDAYVIAGLLPGITDSFNVSSAQAGQAVTVFTLCYAIAAPVFAALLSGKSVRKVLLFALAVFSVANAASALAGSLTTLLIARAIAGFGAGLFSPVAVATAVALVPREKKGRALGLTLGGMSAGTVLGVPLGLLISHRAGWQSTLWLVTALGIAAFVGMAFRFPDIPVNAPPTVRQRVAMLTNGRVAATVGVSFLTATASLGLYTYISPILRETAVTVDVTPYLWFWGVGGLAGSFAIGRLIDKANRPGSLLTGILALLVIALFAIPTALHAGALAFIPFFVWGAMGWSSLAPQQHTLLALQPEHGSAAVALNSSCNYLGSAVGTMLAGALIAYGIDPSALPYFAGVVALAALAGHALIQRIPPKQAYALPDEA
jgi:predicted MFS family arabinose efflux permease